MIPTFPYSKTFATVAVFVSSVMMSCETNDYTDAYDATAAVARTTRTSPSPSPSPAAGSATAPVASAGRPDEPVDRPVTDIHADVGEGCDKAYDLGFRAASRMLSRCRTNDAIRNELLDLRAREYAIRTQIGSDAADAYLQGIRVCIEQQSDTLAATLFQ